MRLPGLILLGLLTGSISASAQNDAGEAHRRALEQMVERARAAGNGAIDPRSLQNNERQALQGAAAAAGNSALGRELSRTSTLAPVGQPVEVPVSNERPAQNGAEPASDPAADPAGSTTSDSEQSPDRGTAPNGKVADGKSADGKPGPPQDDAQPGQNAGNSDPVSDEPVTGEPPRPGSTPPRPANAAANPPARQPEPVLIKGASPAYIDLSSGNRRRAASAPREYPSSTRELPVLGENEPADSTSIARFQSPALNPPAIFAPLGRTPARAEPAKRAEAAKPAKLPPETAKAALVASAIAASAGFAPLERAPRRARPKPSVDLDATP